VEETLAQRKRPRHPGQRVAASTSPTREISKRERVAVAWSGATFVLIAIAGLLWAPSWHLLWIVLLIFGTATIPQVMIWWIAAVRRHH
jgi:hypothetical protein